MPRSRALPQADQVLPAATVETAGYLDRLGPGIVTLDVSTPIVTASALVLSMMLTAPGTTPRHGNQFILDQVEKDVAKVFGAAAGHDAAVNLLLGRQRALIDRAAGDPRRIRGNQEQLLAGMILDTSAAAQRVAWMRWRSNHR